MSEEATETGMLHGIDAYNDSMGQGLRRPPHPYSKDGGPASDASHLCPDCTWHRMVLVRGMWRCPGCNNH